jgi:hypothetical protein
MARVTFKYYERPMPATAVFPNGTVAYRPNLEATLVAMNGNKLRVLALADSGADHCVFPLSFATALKLDHHLMPHQLTGAIGKSDNITYSHELTINLGKGLSFTSYVGFTEGLEESGIGLLGQTGFFENYSVRFDHKAKLFHLETIAGLQGSTFTANCP